VNIAIHLVEHLRINSVTIIDQYSQRAITICLTLALEGHVPQLTSNSCPQTD